MHALPRPLRGPPIFPLQKGLVCWLPFDERSGAKVYDRSGKGNNGVISGASWVAGRRGSSLSFDAVNNYVECYPWAPSLYTEITLFALLKILDSPTARGGIIQHQDDDGGWHADSISVLPARKAIAYFYDGAVKSITSSTVLTLGDWVCVGATAKNDDYMRLFIDGIEEGIAVAIGTLATGFDRIRLATYAGNLYELEVIIADVKIFSRALTPSEMKRLCESELLLARF